LVKRVIPCISKRDFPFTMRYPTRFQQQTLWNAATGVSILILGILLVGLIWLTGLVFGFLQPVLIPLIVAGIIAYLLDPAVCLLEKRGLSRLWAVVVVFGTILTWMQEKTAPCFVVATANDIGALPPELLRKGRFDEIFFLDLPTADERKEIISVHLRKRRRLTADFDVEALAQRSQGYVGAEIEQAVIDAMYAAFNEHREFTTADVLHALERQVPLSVSQRETIGALRDWLRQGRAQSASFDEVVQAEERFVPLQIVRPE